MFTHTVVLSYNLLKNVNILPTVDGAFICIYAYQ